MRVCNISSGSDGNITYIETQTTKILVDIGLSCKETEKRLKLLKVAPESVDAILISHEHSDHIKGLENFANKYKTKVFVHQDGYNPLCKKINKECKIIPYNNDFFINDIGIKSIAVPHDVNRCSAYSIIENEKKISIITDLGHTNNEILKNISGSALIFIEANHDIETLLANPNYPTSLKNRILSLRGHLSNKDSARAIIELVKSGARQIVLSHLSSENNSPQLAFNYICGVLSDNGIIEGENVKIDVASTVPKAIFKL